MKATIDIPERFISIQEFCERSTLSRSEIYNRIHSGELPRPIKLGENRVAFPESVWTDWAAAVLSKAA